MHYVFPVQAKGGTGVLSVVQVLQDIALCRHRFPDLICRPIGAKFIEAELIALFEFEDSDTGVVVSHEKHYRLVAPEQVTTADLTDYRLRAP